MLLATVAHFNLVVWVWFVCDKFPPLRSVYKSLFTVEGRETVVTSTKCKTAVHDLGQHSPMLKLVYHTISVPPLSILTEVCDLGQSLCLLSS